MVLRSSFSLLLKRVMDVVMIMLVVMMAIVMDAEQYYGLITKMDLINFLRKQLP